MKLTKLYTEVLHEMLIKEGVFDPSIFKAIFLAGGPGSGKSYVTKRSTGGLGFKMINSDSSFEHFLNKAGLSHDIAGLTPDEFSVAMDLRGKAKGTTQSFKNSFLDGKLGVIIDGTGADYGKMVRYKKELENIGYDTYMIFVDTSLEVAFERNKMRSRVVPEHVVKKKWDEVQQNKSKYKSLFGSTFQLVNNNNATEEVFSKVWKDVMKFSKKPVKSPEAKKWIDLEMMRRKRK